MNESHLEIKKSPELSGEISLYGAKNAVLVIMASLLLTRGVSRLYNVPASTDIMYMITLLRSLGADVLFDHEKHMLVIDTTDCDKWRVEPEIMNKMRASILVMGPLLARFSKADIALPGGCVIGSRPIDFHLKNFQKMGVSIESQGSFLKAHVSTLSGKTLILDYPSVGATENLLMAALSAIGETIIINAALEPEVLDLIEVLRKMGGDISIEAPATIRIKGEASLLPVEHEIIPDRLEAGSLLIATAITGGSITIANGQPDHLSIFLLKLEEMGHHIDTTHGIHLRATKNPYAVSFKTGPYPSFPTDLQAPMMALLCKSRGKSVIEETVHENRLLHVRELQNMGAYIAIEGNRAIVSGVEELYGTRVIASDIRASCALVIAGLTATGTTIMSGISHWHRGYDGLDIKLKQLGAHIAVVSDKS